jgi:fructose PTS system EIIA component
MPIALADLIDKSRIKLSLHARDQAGAIGELVDLLAGDKLVQSPREFLKLVLKRESTNSTLAENGVAFPHARTNVVDRIVLAIGRSQEGISWPTETQRANLIFLIGVPQNLISDYLVVIGAIARTTKDAALRTLLLHADTAEEFIATMLGAPSI